LKGKDDKGEDMVTDEEVNEFRNDKYWGKATDLYFDDDLTFFKTLGNGKVRKKNFAAAFLNPFSTMYKRYGKIDESTKNNANLNGEGLIMGGLFVVNDREIIFQHKEKDFGTVAPIELVLDAVDEAMKGGQ
jgi:hypothetical protein